MQKLEHWSIDRLIEYARNPRKNDHAVDRVASVIHEFGFRVPILAKSDGSVIDGHLRLKAARKLKLEEVPVIVCDDMTETQIKAFRLSVNKVAELADWDEEMLGLELADLREADFDLGLLGFDESELGSFDVEGGDMPAMPEGDKQPFQQMTFTVHDEQAEDVQAAMAKAKSMGHGESAVNENSNGNALAFICQSFNRTNP